MVLLVLLITSGCQVIETPYLNSGFGAVEGVVVDEHGASLPDVTISLPLPGENQYQGYAVEPVKTDAGGFFQLTKIPSGTRHLRITWVKEESGAYWAVEVFSGLTTKVKIRLVLGENVQTTNTVSGTIQGDDGRGEQAMVVLEGGNVAAGADQHGRFQLKGVFPGCYVFT